MNRGAWQATVHGVAELDTTDLAHTRGKKTLSKVCAGDTKCPC